MALPSSITVRESAGGKPSAPLFALMVEHAGDSAYTTGGSLAYQAFLSTELGRNIQIVHVTGYGYTAGALTHICEYVPATDALRVYVVATGAEVAAAANQSALTFRLTVLAQ